MNSLLIVYGFALVLFVLFIPKGMLAVEIYKNRYKIKRLGTKEWIQCYIPFWNTLIIKEAFDNPSKIFRILNWVFPISILVTVIVRFVFPITANESFILIQLAFTLWMMLIIVVLYLMEVYVHWDLCNILDQRKLKITAIAPPLCSYLLARSVKPYFKKNRHIIDGTFDGYRV